jgi:hypothetical protein
MRKRPLRSQPADQHPPANAPHRVRLPGFVSDDDEIGLGDVIKRTASYLGIQPCAGCDRRATAMNRWLVFARRRPNRTAR